MERTQSLDKTNEMRTVLNIFRGETKEQNKAAVEGH